MAALFTSSAFGQALPAAQVPDVSTGYTLPRAFGSMTYSGSVFESISTGYYNSGISTSTGVSGNLGLISNSKRDTFSMYLSASHFVGTSNQPSVDTVGLTLSQVIAMKRWTLLLGNTVSYLPSTPIGTLSGVPGVGDIGVNPPGSIYSQGLLSNYGKRVMDTASASLSRPITGRTSFSAYGSYNLMNFTGDGSEFGINTHGFSLGANVNHTISARQTVGVSFGYSIYSYNHMQPGFTSKSANVFYTRSLSRKMNFSGSIGPQWITTTHSSVDVPTITTLGASASLNYTAEFTHYSLAYTRGVNGGFGVLPGAESDSVTFTASRTFRRVWGTSTMLGWTRSTNLSTFSYGGSFAPETAIASVQVSRSIGHNLSVFGSYTLEDQSSPNSSLASGLFNGLYNVGSFGLTYAPRAVKFGDR